MGVKKRLWKFVSLAVIICFLAGCVYDRVAVTDYKLLQVEEKPVVLYRGNDAFALEDVKVADGLLEVTIKKPPSRLRTLIGPRVIPEREKALNIYVDPAFEIPETLPAMITIPFSDIAKAEYYDENTGMTILLGAAVVAGVLVAAAIAMALSSCPFVYAFDGDTYEFTGEAFAGAVFPPLERHDYLTLPNLQPVDGEYRLKMANELEEIQHINFVELIVIDHPPASEVLIDKYGVPHTLTDLSPPTEAVTLTGEDVLDTIAEEDGRTYMGDVIEEANGDADAVILTFPKPRGARTAKLVFRGKNSFWLEHVFNRLCVSFGDDYAEWYESRRWVEAEKIERWLWEQGIYLSAYVDKNGVWEFVDYFNFVGPIAAKADVLPLDVSDAGSDEVKVKLEFGSLFWEIDAVALDFSEDLPVQLHSVPPAGTYDLEGRNVSTLLIGDDSLYYVQEEIGEEAFLTFRVPETTEGLARTTILHSKGHYEVLRDPSGAPDYGFLYAFKKPKRFIEFSEELFLDICQPAAGREGQ